MPLTHRLVPGLEPGDADIVAKPVIQLGKLAARARQSRRIGDPQPQQPRPRGPEQGGTEPPDGWPFTYYP